MSDPDEETSDTLDYIQHLHRIGEPPRVMLVRLPLDRPKIVDYDADDDQKWPIELS